MESNEIKNNSVKYNLKRNLPASSKQIDFEVEIPLIILISYDYNHIINICMTNQGLSNICTNNIFWMEWIKLRYGDKIFQLKPIDSSWTSYAEYIGTYTIDKINNSIINGSISDLELVLILYPDFKFTPLHINLALVEKNFGVVRWFIDHIVLPNDDNIDTLFDLNKLDLLYDIYKLRESPFKSSQSIINFVHNTVKNRDLSTLNKLAEMDIIPTQNDIDDIVLLDLTENEKIDYIKYMGSLGFNPSRNTSSKALERNEYTVLKYLATLGLYPKYDDMIKYINSIENRGTIVNNIGIDIINNSIGFNFYYPELIELFLQNGKLPLDNDFNTIWTSPYSIKMLTLLSKYDIYPSSKVYNEIPSILNDNIIEIINWFISHNIYPNKKQQDLLYDMITNNLYQKNIIPSIKLLHNLFKEKIYPTIIQINILFDVGIATLNKGLIKLLNDNKLYVDNNIIDEIVKNAITDMDIDILELLYKYYGIKFTYDDIKLAISLENKNIIDWLSNLDERNKQFIIEVNKDFEKDKLYDWMNEYKLKINQDALIYAAEIGDINILDLIFKYLDVNLNDNRLIHTAIDRYYEYNDDNIINWLLDHDVPEDIFDQQFELSKEYHNNINRENIEPETNNKETEWDKMMELFNDE